MHGINDLRRKTANAKERSAYLASVLSLQDQAAHADHETSRKSIKAQPDLHESKDTTVESKREEIVVKRRTVDQILQEMEPGTPKDVIQEFKTCIKEITSQLEIKVDEDRTTLLATLAKIEEAIEALSEERDYLVRRDERMGITGADPRSVRSLEGAGDEARAARRHLQIKEENAVKLVEARARYAEKSRKPIFVVHGKKPPLRSDK